MKPENIERILADQKNLPSFANPGHRETLEREVVAAAAQPPRCDPQPARWLTPMRWASASAATVLIVAGLCFMLASSPQASLAEVIQQTLAAMGETFHATIYTVRNNKPIPSGEVFLRDGKLIQYRDGKPVLYNENQKTWLLDRLPVIVRAQTMDDVLASQAGLKDLLTELQGATGTSHRQTEVTKQPDATYKGRAVQVWEVRYMAGKQPYHTRHFLADKVTNRIVQMYEWDMDWEHPDDGRMIACGAMEIDYEPVIPDEKMAVALPGPNQIRDVTAARARFDMPGVMVVNRPDFTIELRNIMIGPRGEVVACIVSRTPDGSMPPIAAPTLMCDDCRLYGLGFLNVNYEKPGERLTWVCWIPNDIDLYLSGAAKGPNWRQRVYSLACNLYRTTPQVRVNIPLRVAEEFTADNFQELVGDAIWASGFTRSTWNSFAEFEERTAFHGASSSSIVLVHNTDEKPENYIRWLLRYGELAKANGHMDEVLQWLNGPHRVMIEGSKESRKYRLLKGVSDLTVNAWKEGRTIDLAQIEKALPEYFPDSSK